MQEITAKSLSDKGFGTYTHIAYSSTFNFPKIKTIDKLYGSFANTSINLPSNFIFEIDNGLFGGEIGMAAYKDYLIIDTAIRKEFLPPIKQIIHIDKTVSSISHLWANGNYFHWLLNVIPRICMLQKSYKFENIEVFLVNSCSKPYEIEGFKLLGLKHVIPIYNTWWKCDKIIATPPMSDDAVINPYGCELLRRTFLHNWDKTEFPKKISISRKNGRNITNYDETYNLLSHYGFQTIYCEDYSFMDQIKIFSNAEYIVSPHGAGLANIVFCKPETKVLEILSPIYLNSCFRRIAAYSELDYRFMVGEGEISLEEHRDANITVDINKLKDSLFLN